MITGAITGLLIALFVYHLPRILLHVAGSIAIGLIFAFIIFLVFEGPILTILLCIGLIVIGCIISGE